MLRTQRKLFGEKNTEIIFRSLITFGSIYFSIFYEPSIVALHDVDIADALNKSHTADATVRQQIALANKNDFALFIQ